jgi:sec-independent protein translocase protein TatB
MMRESEIAELEQKWREQNEAIMRAHPAAPATHDWGVASPAPTPSAGAPVSLDKPAEAPMSLAEPTEPSASSSPPKALPPLIRPAYPAPRRAAAGDEAE